MSIQIKRLVLAANFLSLTSCCRIYFLPALLTWESQAPTLLSSPPPLLYDHDEKVGQCISFKQKYDVYPSFRYFILLSGYWSICFRADISFLFIPFAMMRWLTYIFMSWDVKWVQKVGDAAVVYFSGSCIWIAGQCSPERDYDFPHMHSMGSMINTFDPFL